MGVFVTEGPRTPGSSISGMPRPVRSCTRSRATTATSSTSRSVPTVVARTRRQRRDAEGLGPSTGDLVRQRGGARPGDGTDVQPRRHRRSRRVGNRGCRSCWTSRLANLEILRGVRRATGRLSVPTGGGSPSRAADQRLGERNLEFRSLVFEVDDGEEVLRLQTGRTGILHQVSWSPDGRYITGGDDPHVWER